VLPSRLHMKVLFLLIAAMAADQVPVEQKHRSEFRADTRVVEITIAATRTANKLGIHDLATEPIDDLRATDLSLFDNSKKQDIISLEKLDKNSVRRAHPSLILLDALNTSFGDQLYGREGVSQMLGKLATGSRVAIFALGDSLHLLHDFSADYSSLRTAVEKYEGELPLKGVGNPLPGAIEAQKSQVEYIVVDRLDRLIPN
jgi:hypothetical protein